MRFPFLFVVFISTLNVALAQTQADWIHHNGAYTTDRGTAVAVDKQSNVFVAGIFTDTLYLNGQTYYGDGFLDSYVAKLDSNGNYVWIQLVHGPKDDQAERLTVIPNGDVVVTGTFADSVQIGTLIAHAQANDDVWLTRLSSVDGTPQWLKSAGSYYSYERVGGLTSNINYIYWGINFGSDLIIGNDTITADGFNDALVATCDFDGNVLETDVLTGSGNDNITAMTCNDFGQLFVGGRFNGTFYGDTAVAGFDLFYGLLYGGTVEWMKTYGGQGSESITAITRDANDNVYLAGWFIDSLPMADTTLLPDDVWSDRVFVESIDGDGNPNWYYVGFPDSGADNISDIAVACNGDLLFTGYSTYFANQSPEAPKHHPQTNVRCQFGDTYIARMSNTGELLWIKNTLGTNLNSGLGIAADSSGHIYVTGYFTDSLYLQNVAIDGRGGNDAFLFRLNDLSCVTEDTTVITVIANPQHHQAVIYPNPSNGNSYLLLNEGSSNTMLTLTDVSGKTLDTGNVKTANSVSLQDVFAKQAAGIYFVNVTADHKTQTLKWVITP